jgi:hypothetical protein
MSQPNLVVRNTPGGSLSRGGLSAVAIWIVTAIASNNGVTLDPETLAGAAALLSGGISAVIRFISQLAGAQAAQ